MDPDQIKRNPDPRPHQCDKLDQNLQMTSQNVWNMSLFEHFFKVLIETLLGS
jgi:hypothetical protein